MVMNQLQCRRRRAPEDRLTRRTFSLRLQLSRLRGDRAVAFRPAVAEELPHLTDFRDHVEIEIRDDHFVFIPAGLRDDLAAGIAEVALAVKLADAPRLLDRLRD